MNNISTLYDIECAVTEFSLTQASTSFKRRWQGEVCSLVYQSSCLSQYYKYCFIPLFSCFSYKYCMGYVVFVHQYSDTPEINFNLLKNTRIQRVDPDAMPDSTRENRPTVLYIMFGPPKMELLPTPMMSCIAVLSISLWFIPCIAKTKFLF